MLFVCSSRDLYVVHDLMLSFASPSLPPSSFKLVLSTADALVRSSGDSLFSVSESDFSQDARNVLNDLRIYQWNQENKATDSYLIRYLQYRLKNKPFVLLLVAGAGLAVV